MDGRDSQHPPQINEHSKNEQLNYFRDSDDGEFLTTDQGVRVSHTDDSLKAGDRGPTLMEDFHFREKLTHFDHEPIPERIVHARGSGAHGYFECTRSMRDYTMASFLSEAGKKTPVFVRFSQVVGNKGSADTVRDVRGFATKFYTDEGNYDLVGNNIPIFFIQDAIKFPDLVHAIKPDPDNHMPQASAAHDTFWDFISLMPESMHMILWLLSDRGIPRSYGMMEGFGVNTFRFINAAGKAHFVKFHWKPLLGMHSLVWDEAQKLAGKDPDFLRRDLWEAIEMGQPFQYELGVQLLPEEEEHRFDFDVLDVTKIWPEEEIPIQIIGKMTLNRNPDNFFAETEQVAFHPGNVVRGIDVTNDPLLQGRLFSYLDTQLIRLGGPNFTEIPINKPLAPVHNNQRRAYHRQTINQGKVNYFLNSLQDNFPKPASPEEGGYVHYTERVEGRKIRNRSDSFRDHFSQAKLFWNSLTPPEQQHLVNAAHFELGKVKTQSIRQRMVALFAQIDSQLAERVAMGIGVTVPRGITLSSVTKSSPALSMARMAPSPKGRKVAILLDEGYNHQELMGVTQALTAAGVGVKIVSMLLGVKKSADGQEVEVDKHHVSAASILFDAIFIPGGRDSVEAMKQQGDALHFINEAYKHCKPIAALSEGVDFLLASSIRGLTLASPANAGQVVTSRGVVTAWEPVDLDAFIEAFMQAMAQHRHWDRDAVKTPVPA
jgi:catalase